MQDNTQQTNSTSLQDIDKSIKEYKAWLAANQDFMQALGNVRRFNSEQASIQKTLKQLIDDLNGCISSTAEVDKKKIFEKYLNVENSLLLLLEFVQGCESQEYALLIEVLQNNKKEDWIEKIEAKKTKECAFALYKIFQNLENKEEENTEDPKKEKAKEKKTVFLKSILVNENCKFYPSDIDQAKLILGFGLLLVDPNDLNFLISFLNENKLPQKASASLTQRARAFLGEKAIREQIIKELREALKGKIMGSQSSKKEGAINEPTERAAYIERLRKILSNIQSSIINEAEKNVFIEHSYERIDTHPDEVAMTFYVLFKDQNMDEITHLLNDLQHKKGNIIVDKISATRAIDSAVQNFNAQYSKIEEFFHSEFFSTIENNYKLADSSIQPLTRDDFCETHLTDKVKEYENSLDIYQDSKYDFEGKHLDVIKKEIEDLKEKRIKKIEDDLESCEGLEKINKMRIGLFQTHLERMTTCTTSLDLLDAHQKETEKLLKFVSSKVENTSELKKLENILSIILKEDLQELLKKKNSIIEKINKIIQKLDEEQKRIGALKRKLYLEKQSAESDCSREIQRIEKPYQITSQIREVVLGVQNSKIGEFIANIERNIQVIEMANVTEIKSSQSAPQSPMTIDGYIFSIETIIANLNGRRQPGTPFIQKFENLGSENISFDDELLFSQKNIDEYIKAEKKKKVEKTEELFKEKIKAVQAILENVEELKKVATLLKDRAEKNQELLSVTKTQASSAPNQAVEQKRIEGIEKNLEAIVLWCKSTIADMSLKKEEYIKKIEKKAQTILKEIKRKEDKNEVFKKLKKRESELESTRISLDTSKKRLREQKEVYDEVLKNLDNYQVRGSIGLLSTKATLILQKRKRIKGLVADSDIKNIGTLSEENKNKINGKIVGFFRAIWYALCSLFTLFYKDYYHQDYQDIAYCMANAVVSGSIATKEEYSTKLQNILTNLNISQENFKEVCEIFQNLKNYEELQKVNTQIIGINESLNNITRQEETYEQNYKQFIHEKNQFNQTYSCDFDSYSPENRPGAGNVNANTTQSPEKLVATMTFISNQDSVEAPIQNPNQQNVGLHANPQ